jgi:hypothetical protein
VPDKNRCLTIPCKIRLVPMARSSENILHKCVSSSNLLKIQAWYIIRGFYTLAQA